MSLFTKLYEVVHSWRRRRVGIKPSRKRSEPAMEQLDHRQLLAVNFTGVAATDFPVTANPGVQVIANPPFAQGGTNTIPLVPVPLQGIFTVSGNQINQLRVSYTQADDTLNVGIEGPQAGLNGNQVIAADVDNNGNQGTVDPRITAIDPGFQDPANFGGSKTYGVSLAFNNTGVPDVVAGFPVSAGTDPFVSKPYQVARALPVQTTGNQSPQSQLPGFDETQVFPQYTGNYYYANSPTKPNLEIQIAHFSQLYQQITGQVLTPTSPLEIGAFASLIQNGGTTDEIDPPLPVNLTQATVPTPPPPPPPVVIPPVSPPVFVNPHANNHVNTAHNTAVRVNVLGSSGFDPTTIIPSTVRLGNPATIATNGAPSILNFEHNVNRDGFPDETFIFNGLDVQLPPGITNAEITGTTTSGQTFASSVQVFNRDASYFTQAQINRQQANWAKYDLAHGIDTTNGVVAPPVKVPTLAQQRATSAAINDLYNPFAGKKVPVQVNPGAVNGQSGGSAVTATAFTPTASAVAIPRKHGKAGKAVKLVRAATASQVQVSNAMPTSMNLAGAN